MAAMTFGEKLRQLMNERHISQRKLAALVPCDNGHLSKVANGHKRPSPGLVDRLDELLDAGGQLRALRPEKRNDTIVIRRRQVLEMGIAGVAAGALGRIGHSGPVDPELVEYFRQQLPGHYRADMWLGPHMLIPTVTAQTDLIRHLLHAADIPVRHGLLEMGVAYAELLGWLYQDAAALEQSGYWRTAALEMAHRSGNLQLVSYALTNKAMHAIDEGDTRAVIDYASAALADESRLCAKVRVLALVHLGHGHAMTGDRTSADRAFDRAEALIPSIDDDHPWANACRRTPHYTDAQRATAYGRASDHDNAATTWDRVLGDQPTDYRRDSGVFRARQANSLAAATSPDPERVVAIAQAAATACGKTGSARLRAELIALPAHAARWSRSAQGRELVEIIGAIT